MRIFFIAIPLLGLIFAQNKIGLENQSLFLQAMRIERSGDILSAEKIYKNILDSEPTHQPSFFQLKNIFNKNNDLESGIQLIEVWLKNNPTDYQSMLSLGEFYFKNQKKSKAIEIWDDFRNNNLSNKTMYRLLFHTYIKFGQSNSMELLAKKGRGKFNEPHFLAIELANYYQSRQAYERSLEQLMLLIRYQKQYLRYATDRILIMSDDSTSHSIIDSSLNANLEINPSTREVLGGFYYKIGNFTKAYEEYKLLDFKNNEGIDKWLVFADNLRKEGQFDLSIQSYHYMLENLNQSDPLSIAKILLGLGSSYEDQIIKRQSELKFVKWFSENSFFNNQFIRSPDVNNAPLANSLEHYQSLLALLPNTRTTATVHYRLAQIQARIMRDFEGAKSSYETALKASADPRLKSLIYSDIGKLLIYDGKYKEAKIYFQSDQNENLNDLTVGYLNSLLYGLEIDSAITFLDEMILSIDTNNKYFNDFFEIHDLIINYYSDGTKDDKIAFKEFFKAESLINEYKIKDAIKVLENIRINHSDSMIYPIVTLRMAFLSIDLMQYEKSIMYALAMEDTNLKDMGLTLAAEIEESYMKNSDNALMYYYRVLSECSNSILADPVRLHLRKISKNRES
jgi:tetratricopeptide (TPR) repeat protein